MPYAGDESKDRSSIVDWLRSWAFRDGCSVRPARKDIDPSTVSLRWEPCSDGVVVAHLRLRGGQHAWPGATPPDPGPPTRVNAAVEAWRFVRGARLAPPGVSPTRSASPPTEPHH